jgi:hypothetical protein
MSDIPVSDKPRQKNQARIIHRPSAVQMNPGWPVEEPDPQFDPGTVRPVEMSEKDNAPNKPTNDIAEEVVVAPVATLNTAPADDATVSTDTASLTEHEPKDQPEEPQAGAAAAQNADQEAPTTASSNTDDAGVGEAGEAIFEREIVPAAAPEEAKPTQNTTDTTPASLGEKDVGAGQHGSVWEKALPANAHMVAQAMSTFMGGMTEENASEESRSNALANFNMFRQAIRITVEEKKSLPEKKSYLDEMLTMTLPLEKKAKALNSVICIMRGEAAHAMKKGIPHGEFIPFLKKAFTQQRVRKIQEDMSFSKIKSVERHCAFGPTLLLKLAAIINKSNELSKLSDPIQTILDKVQNDTGLLDQSYETLADIAIADFKLKKAQLVIDLATLRDFIAAGYTLGSKDIKEMLAMQQMKEEALARGEDAPDPSDFLMAVIESAGTRVFALTGTPTTEEEMDASPDVPRAIPEINSTLVKTTETLTQALRLPEFPKKDVDRIAVRNLMEVLKRIDAATNQS